MLNFFWRLSDSFFNSLIDLDIDTPQIVFFFHLDFCLHILYQDIKAIELRLQA